LIDINDLPIQEKIQFDIESYAAQIEFDLAGLLKEPPKGVYISNRLEPVMMDGYTYYYGDKNTNKALKEVKDLNEINDSVYNSDYKTIIPKQFMLNKQRFLSNHPLLPYRGIKIMELLIKDEIYSSLEYLSNAPNVSNKVKRHFLDTLDEDKEEQAFIDCLSIASPVLRDVERFIGKDTWHIYRPFLRERVFEIEKLIDHRIYEWTLDRLPKNERDEH
jgi:hypothetical protein